MGESIRLLLTMGDPAGVGPEVLLKSLAVIANPAGVKQSRSSLTVIGDLLHLRRLSRHLRLSIPWEKFRWIDLKNLSGSVRWGRVQPQAGKAAYQYLLEAVRRLKENEADVLVTAPVSKEAIAKAGIPWIGHTEFLGDSFHRRTLMMFVTKGFRASLATTHVSVRELPQRITRTGVLQTLRLTRESLIRDFGISRPRIGLAALNPHGGEGGLFGQEEETILRPAVRSFKASAVRGSTGSPRTEDSARTEEPERTEEPVRPELVEGPFPADNLIKDAAQGRYDAIVALYHDQALIPVKLIGWEQAVNVTLGLPFVRTSPVHGTAFDLAGKGKADPRSMRSAITLAIQLARRRAQPSRH